MATVAEPAAQDRVVSAPGRVWPDWFPQLERYQKSSNRRAAWQLANAVVPYLLLWYAMILTVQHDYSYLATLLLAVPAAAFLIRIFILFHDCAHGSLFPRKGANTFFGYLCGVLVLTSLDDWRLSHLRHHATYANLDTRGFGDIWTMTLAEYRAAPLYRRLAYRFYRSPWVLVGLGALFSFVLAHRLPARKVGRKERTSVLFTDLLILAVFLLAWRFIGWKAYLLTQLPVVWLAGAGGIWLFYVQHQFKGVYWARKEAWDPLQAAFHGSSFYNLPAVLRWFSGCIGYHHVHHLRPRIPNYNLKACYDAVPALQNKEALGLRRSFASIDLKVWDEERQELVAFPAE